MKIQLSLKSDDLKDVTVIADIRQEGEPDYQIQGVDRRWLDESDVDVLRRLLEEIQIAAAKYRAILDAEVKRV